MGRISLYVWFFSGKVRIFYCILEKNSGIVITITPINIVYQIIIKNCFLIYNDLNNNKTDNTRSNHIILTGVLLV